MKDVDSMGETGFTGRVEAMKGLLGKFQRFEGPVCESKKLGQARGESSSEAHCRSLPPQMVDVSHPLYNGHTCKHNVVLTKTTPFRSFY